MTDPLTAIDPAQSPVSPAWIIDRELLEENLRILAGVQEEAGCRILLALKGFATWSTFDLVQRYLTGATASSPHEARLAGEKLAGKEVHACAPAYSRTDLESMLTWCNHVVFNSLSQWQQLRPVVEASGRRVSCGLRINPAHREAAVEIYDPCAPRSRLGVTLENLRAGDFSGLEGLHFHTLCEQGVDALERTLAVVERDFAPWLEQVRWVNFGGGHHITRPDYDRQLLVQLIRRFRQRYQVEVILEPGEAVAIGTGVLMATVLDIIDNDGPVAILDVSASAHMPDVLEMPYRPGVAGAALPGEKPWTCRLAGLTCLAGDIIGDYSFDTPLRPGQRLSLLDMAHYTMVKTTNFNGVQLPALVLKEGQRYNLIRQFGYETYRDRLS